MDTASPDPNPDVNFFQPSQGSLGLSKCKKEF